MDTCNHHNLSHDLAKAHEGHFAIGSKLIVTIDQRNRTPSLTIDPVENTNTIYNCARCTSFNIYCFLMYQRLLTPPPFSTLFTCKLINCKQVELVKHKLVGVCEIR